MKRKMTNIQMTNKEHENHFIEVSIGVIEQTICLSNNYNEFMHMLDYGVKSSVHFHHYDLFQKALDIMEIDYRMPRNIEKEGELDLTTLKVVQ